MNGRWITTWRNKGVLLLLFSSLLLLTATLRADWDFVTINQRTEQLYGPATPEARKRINEWQALLGSLPGSDEKKIIGIGQPFF